MAFDPITKEELLELWRRILPESFTDPIENDADGQGLDLYAQMAAQFERAAEAANVTFQALYLKPHSTQTADASAGQTRATGSVEFTRSGSVSGDFVIPAGLVLVSVQKNADGVEVDGPEFEVTTTTTIASGDLGPVSVPVRAVRVGYHGNVRADTITKFKGLGSAVVPGCVSAGGSGDDVQDVGATAGADRLVESMVGQYLRFASGTNSATYPRLITGATVNTVFVNGPALLPGTDDVEVLEWSDLGLTITNPAATAGGKHGFLDALGTERGKGRQANESDDSFRARVCAFQDIITPNSILRIAAAILGPIGANYELKETRDPNGIIGFVWDFNAFDAGDISNGQVLLGAGCGDVRFFVLCVGLSGAGEFGAAYDSNAGPTPNAWGYMPFDGYAVGHASAMQALYASVEAARAAGICWELVLDPDL